jgi:hypothetical protein
MFRILSAIGFCYFVTVAPVRAIDLPLTSSDVKAAISYGQSTAPNSIVSNPAMQLGSGESALQPWGSIVTPFLTLAFAAAQAHAEYQNVSNELIREAKASKTFTIMAQAFNTELRMNDNMVVVIKQNEKVIHPVSKRLHSDEEVITSGDQAGYRTSLDADFSYKSVNLDLLGDVFACD